MLADAANSDVISGWVQIGGIVGAVLGGAWLVIRGRVGEANTAISQTRAEATEIWKGELVANRELFQAMRLAAEATRDAAISTNVSIAAVRDQVNRLVTCQEAIVRMMEKEADEERTMERTRHQLLDLLDKEREQEEARRRQMYKGLPGE